MPMSAVRRIATEMPPKCPSSYGGELDPRTVSGIEIIARKGPAPSMAKQKGLKPPHLKAWMAHRGIRNRQLAEHLGVANHTVSRWRTPDDRGFEPWNLPKILEFLDVSEYQLFNVDPRATPDLNQNPDGLKKSEDDTTEATPYRPSSTRKEGTEAEGSAKTTKVVDDSMAKQPYRVVGGSETPSGSHQPPELVQQMLANQERMIDGLGRLEELQRATLQAFERLDASVTRMALAFHEVATEMRKRDAA